MTNDDSNRDASKASLRRLGRRRSLSRLLTPLLIVAVLGGVGYWVYDDSQTPEPSSEPTPEAEANAAAERLRAEFEAADTIDAAFVTRAEEIAAEYEELAFTQRNPFVTLLPRIHYQRKQGIQRRLAAASLAIQSALDDGRVRNALDAIEAARAGFVDEPKKERELMEELLTSRRKAIDRRFEKYRDELAYLERARLDSEWQELYARVQTEFAGTPFGSELGGVDEAFRARVAEEEAARRTKLASIASRVQAETASDADLPAEKPQSILAPLLYPFIARGDLAGREYDFAKLGRGAPVSIDRGWTVTVRLVDGESRTLPFDSIPDEVQLRIAEHALAADALLVAAETAYAWGYPRRGDALVYRYVELGGEELTAHREIARMRGLAGIPAGGFEYRPGHGWLDAVGRSQAQAVDAALQLIASLSADTSEKAWRATVAELSALLDPDDEDADASELESKARQRVRQEAVNALQSLETELISKLPKRATTAMVGLRRSKVTLRKLREDALQVIYDTEIYLPETHVDWPRGDRINGQEAVDKVVAKVREKWDSLDKELRFGKDVQTLAAQLRVIRYELYPRLVYTPEATDRMVIDVINNVTEAPLTGRTFALDRREVRIRDFNDAVRRYHDGFSDPDVDAKDLQHIVFVNDYREMMGRRRTFVDARLCRATRKHSRVCDQAGEIWHVGRDGSPDSRARAEGFTAGVGENVAIGYGNPEDIWSRGWYRASDHHRNGLQAGWNCLGYGYVGRVGTQNFATIAPPFEWSEAGP